MNGINPEDLENVLHRGVLLDVGVICVLLVMNVEDLGDGFFIGRLLSVEFLEEFNGIVNKLLVIVHVWWGGTVASVDEAALVVARPWAWASNSALAPSFLSSV